MQNIASDGVKETKESNNAINTIERLLNFPQQNNTNKYILKWEHICNAMKHELYNEIASVFMTLINNNKKQYKNINDLMNDLKNKKRIDEKEINYIKQLINRAKISYINQANSMLFIHMFINLLSITFIFLYCYKDHNQVRQSTKLR